MKTTSLVAGALFFLAAWGACAGADTQKTFSGATYANEVVAKSASTSSVGSRATVSSSTTLFGGFELTSATTVYLLIRGNSLGSLGITSNYLDAPRVRLFNQGGQDLVTDGTGRAGFNGCVSSNATTDLPVINYYASRGAVQSRDTCLAAVLQPGAYTFSVTPSIVGVTSSVASSPASGEVLFEVTLGPSGSSVDNNRTRTERLVGGKWDFLYTIISTFSQSYVFTSVAESTATPGDYVAFGTDQFGDLVIGTYSSRTQLWGVLDQSVILDRFFTFTFRDNNNVSGCYYQISPPGSTNLGTCYSMTGSRFPPKAAAAPSIDDLQEVREAQALDAQPAVDPAIVEAYQRARREHEARKGADR